MKTRALQEEEKKRPPQRPRAIAAQQPPPHSSPPTAGANIQGGAEKAQAGTGWQDQVSNKPFKCCLQQYGVETRVRANTPDQGVVVQRQNGVAKRWQRVFGLFGTKIAS